MKSACCKHEIVIQTDPKNCAYVIISGAQKKTEDYDAEDAETLVLPVDEGKYYSCIEELFGAFLDEFILLLHLEKLLYLQMHRSLSSDNHTVVIVMNCNY